MALLHWRKFVFFDEDYIIDTELNQLVSLEQPENVLEIGQPFVTVKLSCSSSGCGTVLLGDTRGYVYIVNRNLEVNSFKPNKKFTSHVKQVPKLPVFLTCGADEDGENPLVKLWDPEKTDPFNRPTCIRLIRANSGFIKPSKITCIECNDSLTLMAIGFEDGSIVLFHGDVTKQRRSKTSRPIKISERSISGIVIRMDTTAFISTDREIFFANLSEKSFQKVQLDQLGCQPKCCCLLSSADTKASSESLFAVGLNNAVYFYQPDGRGPCLAFEGEKLVLHRFKTYLVVISRDSPIKSYNDRVRLKLPDLSARRIHLDIYDIKNKYIAHSSLIPAIQEVFDEWGQLFVICTNGQVIVFREKDTQTKLETLFRKNQFSLVIDIAKSHQYNEDALAVIFKHYGDHLYSENDYEGAIQQYIKTIGSSEPSYVIKKFLDLKKISNLTVYLEALHQKSQASQDHTKLLLNCYLKLRSDHQLKQFIESYEEGNIRFDVEIAIKVLRGAGFHDFAVYLAKKHQKHESFFKIQLEDKNNSEAALEYMDQIMDTNEMAIYMKKYGRTMLKDAPEKTISMIKTICQRSRENADQAQLGTSLNLMNVLRQIYPEKFFHIFDDQNELLVQLLEQLIDDGTDFATKAVHNLLLELYLNDWKKERDELLRNPITDKIKKLLSQPGKRFDLDQALILCRNNRFDEGLIDLYAQAGLYDKVLEYHISQQDSLKIIKTCEKFGNEDPNLFKTALLYYAKAGDEKLGQLLNAIEHRNTIAPMVVISILLESPCIKLGQVKTYLSRFLEKLHDRHLDNVNAIDQYRGDKEADRKRIEEVLNDQTVFEPSHCSACQGALDLPSVHFLCKHSYHQNCFHNYSAETDECPVCINENRKLLVDIGSHEASTSTSRELEEQFSTSSEDMFNSLAKLFGYGLFNK